MLLGADAAVVRAAILGGLLIISAHFTSCRHSDRARQNIKSFLPNPEAALQSGILLGIDNEPSPNLDEAFRTTGMTHIIAISGLMEVM